MSEREVYYEIRDAYGTKVRVYKGTDQEPNAVADALKWESEWGPHVVYRFTGEQVHP